MGDYIWVKQGGRAGLWSKRTTETHVSCVCTRASRAGSVVTRIAPEPLAGPPPTVFSNRITNHLAPIFASFSPIQGHWPSSSAVLWSMVHVRLWSTRAQTKEKLWNLCRRCSKLFLSSTPVQWPSPFLLLSLKSTTCHFAKHNVRLSLLIENRLTFSYLCLKF